MTQIHRRLARRPLVLLISNRGFTLVELIVVMAIVAILGTIAAPSLGTLITQNRVASEINSFVGDLQWARGEAVKRGIPVVVCASSDGKTCLTNNKWESGWLAFADLDADGTLDATEQVIKVRSALLGGDALKITKPAASPPTIINFSRDGFAVAPAQYEFELKPPSGNSRCLQMGTTGRMTVLHGVCP